MTVARRTESGRVKTLVLQIVRARNDLEHLIIEFNTHFTDEETEVQVVIFLIQIMCV
jgi:hypothetical protein